MVVGRSGGSSGRCGSCFLVWGFFYFRVFGRVEFIVFVRLEVVVNRMWYIGKFFEVLYFIFKKMM